MELEQDSPYAASLGPAPAWDSKELVWSRSRLVVLLVEMFLQVH